LAKKIEKSELSVTDFFDENNVPFSRSQFYLYKRRFKDLGLAGISDQRGAGGNKKVSSEIESFITDLHANNIP